jgi:hypothetical protein
MNDSGPAMGPTEDGTAVGCTGHRSALTERLSEPNAVLTRSDLAELGWPRRGVDAVVRGCGVVAVPGYSRPVVRVADYLAFVERNTYRGDRVRP